MLTRAGYADVTVFERAERVGGVWHHNTAIAPAVAQLDVYQRSPGWTLPKTDFAYSEATKRMFTRLPALQRLDRAFAFAFHELGALAMTSQPWLLPAFRALVAASDQQGRARSAAAAQGHSARRGRLQARDAHRRVVSDAQPTERGADRRADPGDHLHGHPGRGAGSGRRR